MHVLHFTPDLMSAGHICFVSLCLFARICGSVLMYTHVHGSVPIRCQFFSACLHVLSLPVVLYLPSLQRLPGLLHPPCTHPALCPLSPSDRLALCQERMFVFESCQDIKHGRSPARGRINNKLAASSKVRGNMTSQSASLIGSGPP